jgi:riboflavin-specific deaminase-like protein
MSSLEEQNENDAPVMVVTLKMAFDRSGGVADLSQERSKRFTSPGSLDLVHRLRRCSHVVLVGRGTVERDDCTLTVRRVPSNNQPVRVVIDPQLTLFQQDGNSYQLLQDGLATTIVYCAEGAMSSRSTRSKHVDLLSKEKVVIAPLAETNGNLLAIDMVQDLKDRGLYQIMVEGGPATARAFLKEKMVDRAILIRAPLEFREPFPSNITCQSLQDAGLQFLGSSLCDGDTVEYWSRPNLQWPTDKLEEWP